MRALTNPLVFQSALVLFCAACAFLMGAIITRKLRKSIEEEADISPKKPQTPEALPFHLYSTVIQQLKQQKDELQAQSQADQQRARANEGFTQAVLCSLPSGVLVFGTNGLVKTANSAVKQILGFASPIGIGIEDIFRGSVVGSREAEESTPENGLVADEIEGVLHEVAAGREIESEYETPSGERRHLAIAISPVRTAEGSLIGVSCLIRGIGCASEGDRSRLNKILERSMAASQN